MTGRNQDDVDVFAGRFTLLVALSAALCRAL
jgi:hypothetical protein